MHSKELAAQQPRFAQLPHPGPAAGWREARWADKPPLHGPCLPSSVPAPYNRHHSPS